MPSDKAGAPENRDQPTAQSVAFCHGRLVPNPAKKNAADRLSFSRTGHACEGRLINALAAMGYN